MSCHSSEANKGSLSLAAHLTGVPREGSGGVEHAFHDLKREGRRVGAEPPSQAEWDAHLRRASLLAQDMEDPARARVLAQFEEAAALIPDGPTFHAQGNLLAECDWRARRLRRAYELVPPAPRVMAALNPALATPDGLTTQVRSWYPEEADPDVIDELRQADFRLVSVDLETTGFDPVEGAQVTEVSWYCLNTGDGGTFVPSHDLVGADPQALEISRYYERIAGQPMDTTGQVGAVRELLGAQTSPDGGKGPVTYLVGSNPAFDALHLTALFAKEGVGAPKFNHRKIDSAQAAYWLTPTAKFGIPTGLKEASEAAGVTLEGHHDAWVDTTTAARLWHVWERARRTLPRPA